MIKRILLATLLLTLFSTPAMADNGRHLVTLKGKAKNFEQSVSDLGGSVVFRHDRTGIAVVEGLDEVSALSLAKTKSVGDVQPDFTIQLPNTNFDETFEASDILPESPDDPTTAIQWARQWNMRAIDADGAWMFGRLGSPDVTVAILDTGIDYLYPDLDGLVDLSRSASFVPVDDAEAAVKFPTRHPVTDLHYHGTHVAATVASNGLILAGVTSRTTLMGVKVCSYLGGCAGSSIFEGILHAADNGADVANMSLGGGFLKKYNSGYHSLINRIFNYARSQGMTIVVSAGNDALDLDHYPNLYKTYCDTAAAMCVSATGPSSFEGDYRYGPWFGIDDPAVYTNYGRSAVDVAAPGGNTGGYVYAGCSTSSLVIPVCQTGYYIVGLGGTSMAAPHVSGLAALMVEDYGRNPGAIKGAIQDSADDLGQPGTDPFYGKGRINVDKAVH